MENYKENICKGCIYDDAGDLSVGINGGCTHDSLYDDDGNIIDEVNDLICSYMLNGCPLKETE